MSDKSQPTPSSCSRANRVAKVDSSCRLFIVPLFRGSRRFESFILSHHSRFTCESNNKHKINDDDASWGDGQVRLLRIRGHQESGFLSPKVDVLAPETRGVNFRIVGQPARCHPATAPTNRSIGEPILPRGSCTGEGVGFRGSGSGGRCRVPCFGCRDSGGRRRVAGFGCRVPREGRGFRVSGSGEGFRGRVPGSGFRVSGIGFRVPGFGCRVSGVGFRVSCVGFRASGVGLRVSGFGLRKDVGTLI